MDVKSHVLKISGDKLSALLVTDTAMMFSSSYHYSPDEYLINWEKKLSLATKYDVKFTKVKSIRKNNDAKEIKLNYKAYLNIPSELEFSFEDKTDEINFFAHLEKEQYFEKTKFQLSRFRAILLYLLGFLLLVLSIIVSHFALVDLQTGKLDSHIESKTILFNKLITFLGFKGIWILGILVTCYIGAKIIKRFKYPPVQIKFLPPNV
jgi:hypothetical protein